MNDNDVTTWSCPEAGCNGKLIRRTNTKDGSEFLGCTNYPRCNYTQKCEDDEEDIQDAYSKWE